MYSDTTSVSDYPTLRFSVVRIQNCCGCTIQRSTCSLGSPAFNVGIGLSSILASRCGPETRPLGHILYVHIFNYMRCMNLFREYAVHVYSNAAESTSTPAQADPAWFDSSDRRTSQFADLSLAGIR